MLRPLLFLDDELLKDLDDAGIVHMLDPVALRLEEHLLDVGPLLNKLLLLLHLGNRFIKQLHQGLTLLQEPLNCLGLLKSFLALILEVTCQEASPSLALLKARFKLETRILESRGELLLVLYLLNEEVPFLFSLVDVALQKEDLLVKLID
jgi:hypothetical protein